MNESNKPFLGLGSGVSGMRVASLESVLAVATLVSAIVVVLWGIKIFYGL
jgi:hypothetical protein